MKKLVFSALASAALFACTSNEGKFELNIDAPLAGNSPVKIALENDQVIFEGNLKDGKLSAFIDEVPFQYAMLEISELGQPTVFYSSGEDVNVRFDTITGYQIQAGAMHDSAEVFMNIGRTFDQTRQVLEARYSQAYQAGDTVTMQAIREEAANVMGSQAPVYLKFAKRNGILGAAVILGTSSPEYTFQDFQDVADQIPVEQQSSPDYEKLLAKIADLKKSAVGEKFTDFTQATPEGDSLSVLSVEGSYVLVDFWASWCGPCRAANPALVALYNQYHDNGFNIVGVSFDTNADKWKEGISKDNLPWPQLSDLKGWQNEMGQYYGIQYIPQNLLLDDDGTIVGKNMQPEELDEFLKANI